LIDGGATSVAVQDLTNAGLISVQHSTFTSNAGTFTNSGIVRINDATVTFSGFQASASSMTNAGIIQISSGAASFDNQTASSNPGTIDFGAGGAAVFTISGANGLTTIRSQILSGHLTASPSDEDLTDALGSAVANQLGAPNPWHGVPVNWNSILVMRTFAGDADLDGVVSFSDLVAVAQNYGISDGSAYWTSGDFNYDGNVNFADLVVVAQHYGDSMPAAVPGAPLEFQSDLAAAFASVPEPGIPTVLFGSLIVLTKRSARRRLRI
jgi:hypothetical protein